MSQNTAPNESQILDFYMDLSEEEQGKIGNLEDADGYARALDAYQASLGNEESDSGPKVRKEREARDYTVLLMVQTGEGEASVSVVGNGLGSIGRESTEPVKWSDSRKLRHRAEIRAAGLRKKGSNVHVMVVPTEEYLGKFFAA